mgnify:CR=1 FL=1
MRRSVTRRDFLSTSAAATTALWAGASGLGAQVPKRKPNFILIFADDLAYGDLGCFGADDIASPHIDAMAREGAKFNDFYTPITPCLPSRGALLTGRYHVRNGAVSNSSKWNEGERTIADVLKQQGYATACIGKWHLGKNENHPNNKGFDEYYGCIGPNHSWLGWGNLCDAYENTTPLPDHHVAKDDFYKVGPDSAYVISDLSVKYTDRITDFMNRHKDEPFFLYYALQSPHWVRYTQSQFAVDPESDERTKYASVIQDIDWSVGEIMKELKRLNIHEQTCVIFTSDNGGRINQGSKPAPFQGGKFSMNEGDIHMPCTMWWPGTIPAGLVCTEVASTMDFLPTFAWYAGADVPQDRIIDGKDIHELMEGIDGARSPHEGIVFVKEFDKYPTGHNDKGIRGGKWKLKDGKLYNMVDNFPHDIYKDVSAEHPDVVAHLEDVKARIYAGLDNDEPVKSSPSREHQMPARKMKRQERGHWYTIKGQRIENGAAQPGVGIYHGANTSGKTIFRFRRKPAAP